MRARTSFQVAAATATAGLFAISLAGWLGARAPDAAALPDGGWTKIVAANAPPPARYDHVGVYDEVGDQLIIFGGRNGATVYSDTHAFSFSTRQWRAITGAMPPARFGHGGVLDAANRRMIAIMGETSGPTFYNDVWAFDIATEQWSLLEAQGAGVGYPEPRYGQGAAIDENGRVLISHGFTDDGRFRDTWAYDPSASAWANLSPPLSATFPLSRCLHGLDYDPTTQTLFMFGGCASGYGPCPLNDLWQFDTQAQTWAQVSGSLTPTARVNPIMVYDPPRQQLFLFAGRTTTSTNDAWTHNTTLGWRPASYFAPTLPNARYSHSASYDPQAQRVIVFGGRNSASPFTAFNDVWMWRFARSVFLPATARDAASQY